MLNNISTDNVHRKNIWTDSLNNIFYNGCISDEEMKVYCFGAGGGGGGSGDGGVAGDFGAAEAGLGAIGETSATGGKSGTQSDDTGISDALTDAMSTVSGPALSDDAAFGPAVGPSVVDAALPDSTESFFSSKDIDRAMPQSFNLIGSPLSLLTSALLTAIPVVGPILGIANTVLGAIGTLGDVTGLSSLSAVSNFSPTALATRGLSSLATQVGVPSNVTNALTSPIATITTTGPLAPTQETTFGSPFIGNVVDAFSPQSQTQAQISAPIGLGTFDDVRSSLPSISANIQGSTSFADFANPEDDNPIAIRATGGLVSLRDDGGPVISKAQEAYMNWLRSQGGPSALSKRALRKGQIDEVMTPAGPEYFKYNTGESSQDAFGETMYDDAPSDMDMFPFAYPELPEFRELNALGLRRPQPVNNQNTVDVIRKSIIARRRSEDEDERKRRGIVSLMNEGGSIPERFTRADGRPFRPRFGEPGFNVKGVVTHPQQAYMDWLKAHGGPSALSKSALSKGQIDEIDYGGEVGKIYFQYDPGESYYDVYGASMYDDDGDYDMFPFAYPENPDFKLLNALGGGPKNLRQSVVPQNVVDVTRQSVIARRLSDEEEERLRRLRLGLPVVGAYTGGGIQQLVNQEPTLLDVVNKGMSIPEETIPSQRPEQFIKGQQQQPGGLRSTNYYTNAMQPASFYAQPQQVRNYGSIY